MSDRRRKYSWVGWGYDQDGKSFNLECDWERQRHFIVMSRPKHREFIGKCNCLLLTNPNATFFLSEPDSVPTAEAP